MEKDEKKTYKVVGVALERSVNEIAADLGEQLNALESEGYSTQILPVKEGVLLLGKRIPEGRRSDLFGRLFDVMLAKPAESEEYTDRVSGLLASVHDRLGDKWLDVFETELPKVMPSVLKDAPLNVVTEVAQECEEAATKHEKTRHSGEDREHADCPIPSLLRAMAKQMRLYATRNVQ